MKSNKKTKLHLNRETIRELKPDALADVHGGQNPPQGSSQAIICASCNQTVCVGASCKGNSCVGSCGPQNSCVMC